MQKNSFVPSKQIKRNYLCGRLEMEQSDSTGEFRKVNDVN